MNDKRLSKLKDCYETIKELSHDERAEGEELSEIISDDEFKDMENYLDELEDLIIDLENIILKFEK